MVAHSMVPNLIDSPAPKGPKEPFETMALQIETNSPNAFGGAFVIVPPEGDPISTLIIDQSGSVAQFWSLVKAKAELALAEIEQKDRIRWRG